MKKLVLYYVQFFSRSRAQTPGWTGLIPSYTFEFRPFCVDPPELLSSHSDDKLLT